MHRIASESIDTKSQKQDTTEELKVKNVLIDIIEHKAHAIARQEGIKDIAHRGTNARDETIPTALIQRTLDA